VIVHIINVKGVAFDKAENDAPVGANGHGVKALQVALERMQRVTGSRSLVTCSANTPRGSSSS